MRGKLFALFGCLALLAGAPQASAATGSAVISNITVGGAEGTNATHVAIINVSNASGSRPSCHNGLLQYHWAINLTTNKGRALLATATAAMLAGKTVTVTGANVCVTTGIGTFGNLENIASIQFSG